jgi:hypothetical protein
MTLLERSRRVYEMGWRRLLTQKMPREELEAVIWELNFIQRFCGGDFISWARHCLPFYSALQAGTFKPDSLYHSESQEMDTLLEVIKGIFRSLQGGQ